MSKIKKYIIFIERKLIGLLNYFDSGVYMRFYNQYMKKVGIKIGGVQIMLIPQCILMA